VSTKELTFLKNPENKCGILRTSNLHQLAEKLSKWDL
jgi:hypothetical protein